MATRFIEKPSETAQGDTKIDVQFLLAKFKSQILLSGVSFSVLNDEDVNLKQFFEMLENHNDILKIMQTSEIQNSMYGKSYIFFDMLENVIPKIGLYENNSQNQCLRMDGLEQIYIKGSRVLLSGANGISTKIWEYRTPTSVKRLLQSGSVFEKQIPIGEAGTIATPKYIKQFLKHNRITKQNWIGMSAMEITNKDFVDLSFNNQEVEMSDDFAVKDLRNLINRYINWVDWEIDTNHSRIIGNFSNQDLVELDKRIAGANYGRYFGDNRNLAKERLFVKSSGNDASIEIQETNFNLEQHINGLQKLLETYFQGSGLDYGLTLGSGQKSVAEVQTTYKTTYETIKACNQLRTKQWTAFIENIMKACGINPAEQRGKWKLEIKSEILNDVLTNPDTVMQLFNNRLMTLKHAVQTLNPKMTEIEVSKYVEELEAEQEKDNQLQMQSLTNDIINEGGDGLDDAGFQNTDNDKEGDN